MVKFLFVLTLGIVVYVTLQMIRIPDFTISSRIRTEFYKNLSLQQQLEKYERAYQLYQAQRNKANTKEHMEKIMDTPLLWDSYQASFPCPYDVQRVGSWGDGGKQVCGFSEIRKLPNCTVYSFGINNEVTFEEMILEETNCTIRMYDLIEILSHPAALLREYPGRVTYTQKGLGEYPDSKVTLKAIMTEHGHDFLDILKIDIEGNEWDTLTKAMSDFPDGLPIGQLQIELHTAGYKPRESQEFSSWFLSLEKAGLRPFYKEPINFNCVWEYSFISLKFGMFKIK